MTPEERARKVLHMSPAGSLSYAGLLANDIANAIREATRAAENDALERAAVIADKEEHRDDVIEGIESSAGIEIRALKHKDVE